VELGALVVEIPARDGEEVRSVRDGFWEPDDDLFIVRAQHLEPLRFGKHRGRLLAKVQTAKRHGFPVDVDKRGSDHHLLPPIAIVKPRVIGFGSLFLRGRRRLRAACGAQKNHRRSGKLEP
jgi:hypothetical protein